MLQSSTYITHFLTHEGEGSLIFLLRKKNLYLKLITDFVNNGGISFFIIKFDLNTYILQYQVDHIIDLTFQVLIWKLSTLVVRDRNGKRGKMEFRKKYTAVREKKD